MTVVHSFSAGGGVINTEEVMNHHRTSLEGWVAVELLMLVYVDFISDFTLLR